MREEMRIKVFIENEAGSQRKNIYNEKTLVYQRSVSVQCAYPYPYGFVLNTKSGDGDALDCHVVTDGYLKSGDIVECVPVGIMEQVEDQLEDHKVLAIPVGEQVSITADIEHRLTEFAQTVFSNINGKQMQVGKFADQQAAIAMIRKCQLGDI